MKSIICALCACALADAVALPHYGDPNQGYDRIPGTRPTPHFAWMKPAAGGPLKTLFILPYNRSRAVVEFGQRIDVEPTWIMTAGVAVRTQAYREGSIATPLFDREADLVLEKIMKERLLDRSRKYDAIVIGKVSWDVFNPDEKAEILRRVREDGTGLVYFGPNRYARRENKGGIGAGASGELTAPDRDFESVLGAYDASVAETILKGVPVDALPLAPNPDHAKVLTDRDRSWPNARVEMGVWIGTARLGKGRVVAVDYQENESKPCGWTDAVAFSAKLPNGWFDWTAYDYAYEMAARALLVAVGRADQLKTTVKIEAPRLAPRLEWDMKLAAKPLESGLWKNPPDRDLVIKHPVTTVWRGDLAKCKVKVEGGEGNAMVTIRDRDGRAVGVPQRLDLSNPSNLSNFSNLSLKRGDYFVCVQAKDGDGKVKDFASAAFRVETDVRITDLATERKHYGAGETIRGGFALTRALKPDERVEVTARDTWGRLVFESEELKVKSEKSGNGGTFEIPVKDALSRLWMSA